MERRLNKRLEVWISDFKESIREKASELEIISNPGVGKLMQFIYDHERITFGKDDFLKRKRVKNVVHLYDRCCAKRATSEQCTRKKKDGYEYCGTHLKGTPHGTIDASAQTSISTKRVELWAQDIQGIMYYIDNEENVYQAEDIVANRPNPKIIAKYKRIGPDQYCIPEFSLFPSV